MKPHFPLRFCILQIVFCIAPFLGAQEILPIDAAKTRQEIQGFGAAVAWYGGWALTNGNREELSHLMFRDLGLSVLRLRNRFGAATNAQTKDPMAEGVEIAALAKASLGHDPSILLTTWSPDPALLSNIYDPASATLQDPSAKGKNKEYTLRRTEKGFDYPAFGAYIRKSVEAYRSRGVAPTWVSIQNEPNYVASWDSMTLREQETPRHAGYPQALAATRAAVADLVPPVAFVGPELVGIGYDHVERYLSNIPPGSLAGIAHHLYHGGNEKDPDSFIPAMRKLRSNFPGASLHQTEFGRGEGILPTAQIMHNALVEEEVSVYLYWDLIWDGRGLIALENPHKKPSWKTAKGFEVTPPWYATRHFSFFIKPGYRRVDSASTPTLRVSAFVSPDGKTLAAVVLNLGEGAMASIPVKGFSYPEPSGVTSVDKNYWVDRGRMGNGPWEFPGRSITTLVWNRLR